LTYVAPADFRANSLAEFCVGLALTTDEADDTKLAAAIARHSARVDDLTNDHFETAAALTFELNGWGLSSLPLPMRCTAITTVKTRNYAGTLTTQAATTYRLNSSLNSAGSVALSDTPDLLELIPGQYLTGLNSWEATDCWPWGAQSVQVVGTFGWTVTPAEIKEAVALMVWHGVKPLAGILRQTSRLDTLDSSYALNAIPQTAQDIIDRYTRRPSF
jgi:hypothetical protein